MSEIKGFSVVPLRIPKTKFTKEDAIHYIYVKKQQSLDKELSERSLFIINPPLNSSLNKIKSFINKISPSSIIENYFVNDEGLDYEINLTHLTSELYDNDNNQDNNDFKLPNQTGLIIFVDKSAANLALNKLKKYSKDKDNNNIEELYKWTEDKSIPASIKFLQMYKDDQLNIENHAEIIDKALKDFEERENKSINDLKNMKELIDEDGFTLVVGKNRKTKKGILGKIDNITKFRTNQTQEKMKKKEKKDFYRFQVREKKKVEMNELLRKFKEDQEKIKILKEKKRFRPY